MNGWLIYSEMDVEKNKRYIEFYYEEGIKQNLKIELILIEKLEFGIKSNTWFLKYQNQEISKPDFAICRTIYPLLNRQLEFMGIPVFNSALVSELCNDKAKTYQYVAQLGIQMIDTSFYRNSMAMEQMDHIDSPTVMKAVAGHGGSQVFLLNEKNQQAKDSIIERLDHADFVLQPLTGSRHQDLRVYVIGKKIIASILRTAQAGFKSNFSLGGKVQLYELSSQEKQIVNRIINLFDFGLVGIDFIIDDDGELIFNEIEDVVGARMLYQCCDINLVRLYLEFIQKQLMK